MDTRILVRAVALAALTALVAVPTASAHVTINPPEWEAGGFARFAVRVPNERPGTATTEVTVQFPENVVSASFQPVPGWKRTVKMARLDQPIEGEDGQITERIDTVTWSGGRIEPGEFQEFGISFQVPEDAAGSSLAFPAVQTYEGGEVVRWIGEEDSDEPAPRVEVLAAETTAAETTPTETGSPGEPISPEAASSADDDGAGTLALVLSIVAIALGLVALGVASTRGRRAT